jgi:hypothetical protein
MEKYHLKKDIKVFCVTAEPFPHGIVDAFQKLENLDPSICERPFYGISFLDAEGQIVYKAAVAEEFKGEAKKFGCETFTITKGEYLAETIKDFMKALDTIPNAFKKLMKDPRMDCSFPCVEWYKSDREVICMIKLVNRPSLTSTNKARKKELLTLKNNKS